MPSQQAQHKPAPSSQRTPEAENPYMNAKSLDELQRMEAQLYKETWQDGKIRPNMEEHYARQMELFLEAYAALFPEEFNFHKPARKK